MRPQVWPVRERESYISSALRIPSLVMDPKNFLNSLVAISRSLEVISPLMISQLILGQEVPRQRAR